MGTEIDTQRYIFHIEQNCSNYRKKRKLAGDVTSLQYISCSTLLLVLLNVAFHMYLPQTFKQACSAYLIWIFSHNMEEFF